MPGTSRSAALPDELAALAAPGFDDLVHGTLAARLATGTADERIRLARYEQFAGEEVTADARLTRLLAETSGSAYGARSQQRLGAAFEPEFCSGAIDWTLEAPPRALDADGIRERVAIAFGRTVADGREPPQGWPGDFAPGDWREQQRLVTDAAQGLRSLLTQADPAQLLDALDLSVWVPMILLMHGEHGEVLQLVDATRVAHAAHGIRALDCFLDYLSSVAHVGLLDLEAAEAPLARAVAGFAKAADRRWWMQAKALQAFVATLTRTELPSGMEDLQRALLEGRWRQGRRSLGHSTLMLLAVALASSGDLEGARRLAVADGGLDELTVPATDRIFLLEIMLYAALADEDAELADRMLFLADRMMASPPVVSVRSRMHAAAEAVRNGSPPPPPRDPGEDPSLESLRTRWMILAQTVTHGSREQAWNALAEFDAFTHRARTAARRTHAIRLFHARTVSAERSDARSAAHSDARPDARPKIPPRLLEVATLAAAGLTNREIAARLFLGVRTVEGYVREVLQLFGVRRRSELGGVWLSMRLDPHASTDRRAPSPRIVDLPLRQAQVGSLIAAGAANAEIAEALGVTEKTVDKHIVALKARIGVRTRTEIAAAFS